MAAVGYDISNHPASHHIGEDDDEPNITHLHDVDFNFTMFDSDFELNIDSVIQVSAFFEKVARTPDSDFMQYQLEERICDHFFMLPRPG
jgi:hypothetical protein